MSAYENNAADRPREDGVLSPESPSFAFDPADPWTQTFQKGLERAGLGGKRVYEVGIGTGINAAFILRMCEAAAVSGSDLDPRLAELAERNVRHLAPEQSMRFHPVKGAVSLIDTPEAQAEIARADVVIGCLPQVGDPGDTRLTSLRDRLSAKLAESANARTDDHFAHYYPWGEFDSYPFNSVGLGLNEALLRRLKTHAPKSDVILNFGSRVGTSILFNFFEANGFKPEMLYSQMVRQSGCTDISFFVALELSLRDTGFEDDFSCEFFADENGKDPLSACQAQDLLDRNSKADLFHEVCVIRGRPLAA